MFWKREEREGRKTLHRGNQSVRREEKQRSKQRKIVVKQEMRNKQKKGGNE